VLKAIHIGAGACARAFAASTPFIAIILNSHIWSLNIKVRVQKLTLERLSSVYFF
jgi:hypothetical protein